MSTVQLELPGISIDGVTSAPKHIQLHVYHVLHTAKGGRIYYDRWGDGHIEQWSRVSQEINIPYGAIIVTLDPITALMRGLATAEEIGLPAGLEGLVALAKAVQNG